MKKITISSSIGIAAIAVGIWWLYSSLQPFYGFFGKEKDTFGYVFLLTLLPFMAFPGAFMTFFGFRLTKENTGTNIKGVVGSFAIMGVFWISSVILMVVGESKVADGLSMLIATLVMIPAYVVVSKYCMKKAGHNPVRGEFVGKGIVAIIAWQIWLVSSGIAREITPVKDGYTHVPEFPWGLVGLAAPILIAVVFYKIAVKLIKKNVEHD